MARKSRKQNPQCAPAAIVDHPAWCSPQHCHRTAEGVLVHLQAPVCWQDDDPIAPVRCESRLLDPADDDDVYLEMDLKVLPFRGNGFSWIVSLDAVAALRDQLTAHLDAGRADSHQRMTPKPDRSLVERNSPR